ncbi:hypothetical protein Slin15195_G033150 [Septoria linicola]|uniref:Uncharacterized protein n=1 Tax=Septoria linicola TaxID=215465 RepID=A0A9Q9EFP9_9PEZI|nr:hypothetical protein Slin14017_G032170 [Septoria linicola]USW49996.1 hypothetical protein Slin15195_G033150 [Septoria linicola]
MFASILLATAALVGFSSAQACTAAERIRISGLVPFAYSQPDPISTFDEFSKIPFGVPDLAGSCVTQIYPNGGGPITVGVTGKGVVNFGVASRQAFSSVTGQYVDFGANGTTVIDTNVTLGVASAVPVPVTFSGQVYLDCNNNCRITAVRAFAQVPTYILGQPTDIYKFLPVPKVPGILRA